MHVYKHGGKTPGGCLHLPTSQVELVVHSNQCSTPLEMSLM